MTSTWDALGHMARALWPSARRTTRLGLAIFLLMGAFWAPIFAVGMMGGLPMSAAWAFASFCFFASLDRCFGESTTSLAVAFYFAFVIVSGHGAMHSLGYIHLGDALATLGLGGISFFDAVRRFKDGGILRDVKSAGRRFAELARFTDEQARTWERGALALSSRSRTLAGFKSRRPRL